MNDIVRKKTLPKPQPQPQVFTPKQDALENLGSLELPRVNPVEPKKKRRLINWLAAFIFGGVFLSLIAATGAYFWYQGALKPKSQDYAQVEVVVPTGSSAAQVAIILDEAGVVKSSLATQLYMTFSGKTNVKAGHYLLSPSQPVAEIIDWLNEGRVDTLVVTILPGKTVEELKVVFLKLGFPDAEVEQAFNKKYNSPLFASKPAGSDLEGYIYPDTYFANNSDSVESILQKTFAEFETLITEMNLQAKLADQGLNLYQGITLASLVYGEVPDYEDRRQVAQVFLRRLSIDMPLGSDVTFKYAAKILGIPASPNIDSPYNTRIVKGLPPGPVSNFTIDALIAVADPTPTDYLYFVSGDDGITRFSHTVEEHEENTRLYCRELCQL